MKPVTKLTYIIVTLVMGCASAFAQSVSVQANSQVVQGRNFTVTFTVTNGEGRVTKDMAPKLPGCTLLYGPAQSTMHSVSIVNGRQASSSSVQYMFTYKADKAGTVTVPATTIVVDGKNMTTEPRKITILPPDRASAPGNRTGYSPFDEMDEMMQEMEEWMNQGMGGGRQQPQPAVQQQSKISPNDLIVTVSLSKSSVYEKEAVIATIKLYTKHNISNFQPTVMPQFEGFLSEELPVGQQSAQLEHFRGENYYSVVLKRCLLYPQKSGKLTINSGSYDVTLQTVDYVSNGFYATPVAKDHAIKTTSNSVAVNVKPLPTPAPAGFNGAVGDFTVTAELTPERLRTNEAATYSLKVSGTGNLKHLAEPKVPFPVSVEEYTPTSETDVNFTGDNIRGSYTAIYTIVPQELGKLIIPSWDFVYFNPATGRYVTTTLPSFERDVAKGIPVSGASTSGAKSVDTSGISDIRHIVKVDESELTHDREALFHKALYWLAYIIALSMLIGAAIVYRRYIKSAADVQGRRTRKARSVAVRRLRKAHAAMAARNNDEFYDALSAAMWGYLSDKLGMPASSLTRDNIAGTLAGISAPEELVNEVISILDECEMARFTPQHSDSEVSSLYNRASAAIDSLQRIKPSKKTVTANTRDSRYAD